MEMGCCGCFGFSFVRKRKASTGSFGKHISRESLLPEEGADEEEPFYSSNVVGTGNRDDCEFQSSTNCFEETIMYRMRQGLICREFPVKETHNLIRAEAFHKSHLLKLRVAPSETAMTDVLREVSIMKILSHPNIVNLVEVIDDPTTDHFYMVLEYVEGKWVCEGAGLGESTARRYLRDIVAGLMYLHSHNIVHGDIKPDNLLVSSNGTVKIGDFSVSQVFEVQPTMARRLTHGQLELLSTVWFLGNTRFLERHCRIRTKR